MAGSTYVRPTYLRDAELSHDQTGVYAFNLITAIDTIYTRPKRGYNTFKGGTRAGFWNGS